MKPYKGYKNSREDKIRKSRALGGKSFILSNENEKLEFDFVSEASELLGVNKSSIKALIKGKIKTCKGYKLGV